jgi:hypothetical protein
MKKIGVYFSDPGEMDYPFTDRLYLEAHQRFAKEMAVVDVKVVVVRGEMSHIADTRFTHYWEYTEEGVMRHDKEIKLDLIYNKSTLPLPARFPLDATFNHPKLDAICHDKMLSFEYFADYMPKSLHIDASNWHDVIKELRTSTITLKPLEGEGGSGISFHERSSFDGSTFHFKEKYLAQEFIDTSHGIPGVTPGLHDLRILVFNGQAKLAVVRIPAPGMLLANIAQGATTHPVNLARIPQEILDIVKKVDAKLTEFEPRIYSIDFLVGPEGAFVVELNSRPGFPHPNRQGEDYASTFFACHRDVLGKYLHAK